MNYTQDQLYNMEIIKDRRRRYIHPLKNKESGYHIHEKDMKKFSFVSGKTMYINLVYVLAVGAFNLPIVLGLLIAFIVSVAITIFEKKFFYPTLNVLKLHIDDVKLIQSKVYLKSVRSNHLSEIFLVSLVLALTVFKGFFQGIQQNIYNITSMYIVIAICIYFIVYNALEWLKVNKEIKSK